MLPNPLVFSQRTPRRLRGLDATFLSLETAAQPMQSIALGILRPGSDGAVTVNDLIVRLTIRLHEMPALRWRIVHVPFGLAHPLFVEDLHLDLEQHVSHLALGEPGQLEQLDAACAQLACQHLDPNRAPWHITLIDGLADGRQAMVLRIHHALMDGFALSTTLAQIFSGIQMFPGIPPVPKPSPDQPDSTPGRGRLICGAFAHHAWALARLPRLIARTRRVARAVRRRQAAAAVQIPKAGADTPQSVINQGSAPGRRFARASLSLEMVLAVKEVVSGATVNDVALALIGGALRGYLQTRGALPDRPLLAFVPVGNEKLGGVPRASGNRFSYLTTSLGTDIADPWQRLQRISMITTEAKACLELAGRELLMDWLDLVPPMLVRAMVRRGAGAGRRAGNQVPGHNVVVSNLRGPSVAWQLGSALMEQMYLAPPSNGIGVNFALWDYAGSLLFGIMSSAGAVDDTGELASRLSQSLAEFAIAECRVRGACPGQTSLRASTR